MLLRPFSFLGCAAGFGFLLASLSSLASAAAPQAPSHPIVSGFERFYAAADSDAQAGGRLLLSELNCLSCHAGDKLVTGAIAPKKAPVLDDVGSRVRPEWIREYLLAPHQIKSGTTMPDVLSTDASVRAEQALALTHFLAETGTVSDIHPDQVSANRGQQTFHRVGCVACHQPLTVDAPAMVGSIPLPDLGKKYTANSLAAFLKDPLKTRPSGRMPAFPLKDEEFKDLAQYFMKGVQLAPNVKYEVFYGNWDKLPDFSTLKPEKTGTCAGFDLTVAGRSNNFAIRFSSNFFSKAPAQHRFFLGSDDGSRLSIGNEVIAVNDGVHPHSEVVGRHTFAVGWQPVVVEYFQVGGEWTLEVDLDGNGLKRQSLAGLLSLDTSKAPADAKGTGTAKTATDGSREPAAGFVVDATLADQGRGLFSALGCANCHQMKFDGKPLAGTQPARPLAALTATAGCLAENPPVTGPATVSSARFPQFRLSARQRTALAAALKMAAAEESPKDLVHRAMIAFNCASCHKRGEFGGVTEERDPYFTTLQKEMGDEGRLPPSLTGVGEKLRDEWMKTLLNNGANDRQLYMQAKMPKFGGGNVGFLVDVFKDADRGPDSAPNPTFEEPEYRVKAIGRHLVGANALSCIKCHDFGPHPSQGVRAINLATMHKRLRDDWFHRYVLDPQAYRPGTRMPAPWPFGTATIRDVLNGDADKQIRAVWNYLADGDKAAVPVGLVREPIELKAEGTPILYRNFIDGAGSRAIGVGYPEKANLAWDANEMRLAMVWHGSFIDASRHWNGRGVGFEAPLGDDVLQFAAGPPLVQLASPNDPWPKGMARENGFTFRGYALDAQGRPTFKYSVGSVQVEDQFVPVMIGAAKFPGFERQLTLTGPASDGPSGEWWFRALTAKSLTEQGGGQFRVDGVWTITVSGTTTILRDAGGIKELVLPIRPTPQGTKVKLRYDW